MVWFQCEDCGDNLKKPKLANHFNMCSASKFSCIDCGANFGQQSVQGHTQCITEAEKYGPKGPGKTQNGATPKPSKDSKQHPDIDITVGLSERPPWFCSLCNTKATSQQTLLLHAEGKKHRGKARAVHASKQQSMQKEGPDSHTKLPSETPQKIELLGKKDLKESELEDISQVNSAHHNLEIENGTLPLKKRRKSDRSEDDSSRKKAKDDTSVELGNGEVIQSGKTEKDKKEISTKRDNVLKSCFAKEETKKIKWKKLIKSVLKSSPDGTLKVKKLRKLVLKALSESGTTGDETELSNTLERKINSSSKFVVENKYVHLAAKD